MTTDATMLEKLAAVLNSLRFWQITVATAFVLLGNYLPEMQFLWNTLAAWLAAVVGIGTLDSVATRISGKEMKGRA